MCFGWKYVIEVLSTSYIYGLDLLGLVGFSMIRKKIVIAGLLLAYAIIVPVFAYIYFYRTETALAAGIELRTYEATMKLGVYWDPACTQNVTAFDFGNMTHPNQETTLQKLVFIRNEGDQWTKVYWNSTLASVSAEITEGWDCYLGDINGTTLSSGAVLNTRFYVIIPAYATPGTYNWTLTVWGENYY